MLTLEQRITDHRRWQMGAAGVKFVASAEDVRGAVFNAHDLMCAVFDGCDLRGCSFIGANLREASFIGANLEGANLSGADLDDADFSGANLQHANLEDADMDEANLAGANLAGANLAGVSLAGVQLPASWPQATGLATPAESAALLEEIRTIIVEERGSLRMSLWHTCATAHCLAGWAQHLRGVKGDPSVVGSQLIPQATHMFLKLNAPARDWLIGRGWCTE